MTFMMYVDIFDVVLMLCSVYIRVALGILY